MCLFWNAKWNESLFLVSCAERLIEFPTQHSENEIFKRIATELLNSPNSAKEPFFQFRLIFIRREGERLIEEILYQSKIKNLDRLGSL